MRPSEAISAGPSATAFGGNGDEEGNRDLDWNLDTLAFPRVWLPRYRIERLRRRVPAWIQQARSHDYRARGGLQFARCVRCEWGVRSVDRRSGQLKMILAYKVVRRGFSPRSRL